MTATANSIWTDGPLEAAFRRELTDWLCAQDLPSLPPEPDDRAAALHEWHRRLARGGFVGLSLPARFGGRGLPATAEAICNEELGLAGAPPSPPIGHLAHALALFGNDEQRSIHLSGMLAGDQRWCQGFSEPDAGSDLGSLTTTAILGADGHFTITGCKLWTSLAVYADWCLLLCRTRGQADDPELRRPVHQMSVLLVPMDAAGVSCHEVTTAWGTREFAEVVFDEVVVPHTALLGDEGHGWQIARQLLAYERGPADIGWVARLRRLLSVTQRELSAAGTQPTGAQRDQWARAHAELRVLEIHVRRSLAARTDGTLPGPEGSLDKLLLTRVDQLVHETVFELGGSSGLTADANVLDGYWMSRAASVYGGTRQIQRDIVGERLLTLPRSDRSVVGSRT